MCNVNHYNIHTVRALKVITDFLKRGSYAQNNTMNEDMTTLKEAMSIGKGAIQVMLIVDPDRHDVLAPFDCVDEVLLEGP